MNLATNVSTGKLAQASSLAFLVSCLKSNLERVTDHLLSIFGEIFLGFCRSHFYHNVVVPGTLHHLCKG